MRAQQLINSLKHSILTLLVLLICGEINAQTFLKSYDYPAVTTRTEIGRSIQTKVNPVTGWTIAGFSNGTPSAGGYDWMYQKLSNTGTVECTTFLGFPNADSCYSHVRNFSARTEVLAGFYSNSIGKPKASISILDTNCLHMISKQISDTGRHQWRQVVVDPSSGKITVAGFIETAVPGAVNMNKIMVAQYSPAGVLLWAYTYRTTVPSVDEAYSICYQPSDGSYAITGKTNLFGGIDKVFILKIAPTGVPIWFKTYRMTAPTSASTGNKIIALPAGQFALTGWTNNSDAASRDILVIRVNAFGGQIWANSYGLPGRYDEGMSLIFDPASVSLIVTGVKTPGGAITEDLFLAKLTAGTGGLVWLRSYPNGAGHDRGYDLIGAPAGATGGYAVTGQVFPSVSATLDPFLMSTDVNGKLGSGCLDSVIYNPVFQQLSLDSMQLSPMPLNDMPVNPTVNNPAPVVRTICVLTGINEIQNTVVTDYALKQNYPNPFNPSTNIEFALPKDGMVTVKIYDNAGKEISTLVNEFKNRGRYIVSFAANGLSTGIYYYKLTSGDFTDVKKMLLIK